MDAAVYVRAARASGVRRVAFEVTYPPAVTHPFHRRLDRVDGVSRMELLAWGPTASVATLSWYDAGPDAVAAVLAAVETVSARHLVAGDGGTYAFVRQTGFEFDDGLMDLVADARVAFLPPVTFRAGGDAAFEAVGEAAAVSRFHARLDELVDVRVDRVGAFRRSPSAVLTERQRAALDAAASVGYYEVPRTGSVEAVAAELGCATSTAGELLRRAESALVAEYTATDHADPR